MPKSKVALIAVVLVVVGVALFLVLRPKDNVDGEAVAQDKVANAPEGCPDSTSVVVKSEEAGTVNVASANSNFIQASSDQARLIFTNYTLNPDDVYSDITGDRVLTVIKLAHQDGTAMTTGTYSKTAETGEATPNKYTSEYNISTVGLAGGVFDDEATVEIDYLGTDYVCGTVSSEDSSSSIKGKFIAKYIDRL